MKRFIALAAALALVGALAVTILTSGEAFSFSESDIEQRIGNGLPPNQAQPQDFAGAGSQFYYFGPDFVCQIFTNTTVRCYGSDANGVVSGAPNGTGFTNVDGGETYACAFHQATRFNQCWGSITLSPTSVQPEPTVEPTIAPTVEPTPTVIPGTVVPTVEPTVEPTPEPNACELAFPTGTLPVTITGSWIAECVYPVDIPNVEDGDRYYRWVGFEATSASGTWTATLTSSKDTYMLLWEIDAATDELTLVDENDDIVQGNTNSRITWTPTQGNSYLIDLTTYNANTLGDFTLTIEAGSASPQGSSSGQSMEHSHIPFERRQ